VYILKRHEKCVSSEIMTTLKLDRLQFASTHTSSSSIHICPGLYRSHQSRNRSLYILSIAGLIAGLGIWSIGKLIASYFTHQAKYKGEYKLEGLRYGPNRGGGGGTRTRTRIREDAHSGESGGARARIWRFPDVLLALTSAS
jgi:hypothetical protein